MSKVDYKKLIVVLNEAKALFLEEKSCSEYLKKAVECINDIMSNANDVITTALKIERLCLDFDRGTILNKSVHKVDMRINAYQDVTENLAKLRTTPEKFTNDFTKNQTYNINSETIFSREIYHSLRYLSVQKNSLPANVGSYQFYEKRQDILKQAHALYLKEKQQAFGKDQDKPLQKDKPKDHDRSR